MMDKPAYTRHKLSCTIVVGMIMPLFAAIGMGQPLSDTTADFAGKNPFAALLGQSEPEEPNDARIPEIIEPPELVLDTIVLKFLDAQSLKQALDKMVTAYGAVAVNTKTNSVIVCETAENLSRIVSEIKKADRMPQQVMVEVVILDVQLRDDTEIGINWDLLSTELKDYAYRQNFTSARLTAVPLSTTSGGTTTNNLANATAYNTLGLGGNFSVISSSVRHVLHLIQEKRNAEILASPRALVVSGQSATIKAVEEIPYQEVIDTATGGANAMTSTEFKDVGVTLRVEATVTDGNNIFLHVETIQNVATGSSAGIPVVDTREATTSLLLEDGQTVVMGGLRREEKTKQIDQIPILGDLPLIGLLFRSVNTVSVHSELVVLLSPRIYKGEAVPGEVAAKVAAMQSNSPLKVEVTGPLDKQQSCELDGDKALRPGE